MSPRSHALVALAVLLFASGCSAFSSESCPDGGDFRTFSDGELWACLDASGRDAIVGLKNPSDTEGVSDGQILVSNEDLVTYVGLVESVPGTEVGSQFSSIPAVIVQFSGRGAFEAVRALDVVEYVEPN